MSSVDTSDSAVAIGADNPRTMHHLPGERLRMPRIWRRCAMRYMDECCIPRRCWRRGDPVIPRSPQQKEQAMFAVIFTVQPKKERWNDYLDLARFLKPKLE